MKNAITATLKSLRTSILVIGYGNNLRSDDGVGQKVADAVAAWREPNVEALAVHQLTPELVERIATVDIVIFVDAYAADGEQNVRVNRIEVTNSRMSMAHISYPSMLLAIAQTLYDYHPQAWCVAVPAVNFELGFSLSAVAERGIAEALEEIERLIRYQPQAAGVNANK